MSANGSLRTVNDLLLVAMAFLLGYYTAQSTLQRDTIVKYRFIPRTASETLAMPDDVLREYSKMFNVAPNPTINAGS